MRITTQGAYGIRCLRRLARETTAGEKAVLPISVLAADEKLSKEYVEQLMLKLRRAGIVESTRGVRGGYRLARAPETVTLFETLEVLEGQTFEVKGDVVDETHLEAHPDDEAHGDCTACALMPVWGHFRRVLNAVLQQLTLKHLLMNEHDLYHQLTEAANAYTDALEERELIHI